jgi:hypothetical protein
MEHTNNLNFTFSVFIKEQKRLIELKLLVKDEHYIQNRIRRKLNSIEGALQVLQNKETTNFDPEYALTHLKANLNWLNRQVEVVPDSQNIIDEIEYVSKLLEDGKD